MTFRQCVIIALLFHCALMLCPLKGAIEEAKKRVVLVVTESACTRVNPISEAQAEPLPVKAQPKAVKKVSQEPPQQVAPAKPDKKTVTPEKPLRNVPAPIAKKPKQIKDPKPERIVAPRTAPPEKEPESAPITEHLPSPPCREEPVPKPPVAGAVLAKAADEPLHEVRFGSAEGPRFVKRALPEFPRKARRLRKTGVVVLMLTIDAAGVLIDVEILKKGGFGFDEAAITAVNDSLFTAARRNGRPVACKAMLPIRFELR